MSEFPHGYGMPVPPSEVADFAEFAQPGGIHDQVYGVPDKPDTHPTPDIQQILDRLDALTERVDVIGQQQQWIVDQVKGAFSMFSQNPITRGAMKRMSGQ